jgi:CheY-like chemotaxis protein
VLLVDDDSAGLELLRATLRRYDVLTATSACFALEMLRPEHVDLVVAAETMPEMPGRELLSIVSRQSPQHVVSESKPA